MTGALTIIQGTSPSTLGKTYRISGGAVTKETAGELIEGTFEVRAFAHVGQFAELLQSVGTNQVICAAVPKSGLRAGRIVTKAKLSRFAGVSDVIGRTKEHLSFAAGPGVLILDYDAPEHGDSLSRGALWELLCKVWPSCASGGVVWWCSSSSFIFNGDSQVNGLRGQRVYVLVADASDVPRVIGVLGKRLWLAGLGRVEVSKSGALLVRSVFDRAMASPTQPDYAGGATCIAPLVQRRGSPVILSDGGFIDSRTTLVGLSAEEEARYAALVEAAKSAMQNESAAAQATWLAGRMGPAVSRLLAGGIGAEEAQRDATQTLRAALGGVLMGDFELTLPDGSVVTVGAVMDDPERWHGTDLRDPLEPDYQGGKTCARLYLFGGVPLVHSFAHGGQTFKLRRQPARVYVSRGRKAEAASEIARQLARETDVFIRSGSVCLIGADGELRPLDRAGLSHLIGTRVAAFSRGKSGDIPADVGGDIVEMIASIAGDVMKDKEIAALALLPFARPDGTICVRPGYDPATRAFLHFDADRLPPVPLSPTEADVVDVLRVAWGPWSAYPFATDEDRGAMLAAIITAVCRPALPLAPGFFFDAPTQAAGKTRCAGALGAVLGGRRGGITPFVGGPNADAEMAKKIVALLRAGGSFLLIDNIVGRWSSAVIAALVTEGTINERVLGSSTWYRGEGRILLTATGNQGEPDADLGRRFIRVRIDPRCERPQARAFQFDPVERALADRLKIAHAVLVLIRAFTASAAFGKSHGSGCGFEDWDRLVRSCVLWLQRNRLTERAGIGAVGDPARTILEGSTAADPEVEAWGLALRSLGDIFGLNRDFTAREALTYYQRPHLGPTHDDEAPHLLVEGLAALLGSGKDMTTTRLGHALRNRRDRIVGGLVLRSSGLGHGGVARWRVVSA